MADAFDQIAGLQLTETIAAAMERDGIVRPTPVQRDAMASVLQGQHVLMHSGTGTGKTLAYVLPILQRLRTSSERAVIFAPGAELVMQIMGVLSAYKDTNITTAAAISTSSRRRQRRRITRSTRVVVGTPDRLLEMFRGGKLKGVTIVVFDEIEPILGARDAAFLEALLSRPEPKRQLIVASATLGRRSRAFVDRFMAGGLEVHPTETFFRSAIAHHVVRVPSHQGKDMALATFIRKNCCQQVIVFASDPRHHRHLFHVLRAQGIRAATVSRDRSKSQRQRGLADFRAGKVQVLLTTDAAARGIDVPDVSWVLHYDLPHSRQAYIHRAGRTGRAGAQGWSVVFSEQRTHQALHRLARALRIPFTDAKTA